MCWLSSLLCLENRDKALHIFHSLKSTFFAVVLNVLARILLEPSFASLARFQLFFLPHSVLYSYEPHENIDGCFLNVILRCGIETVTDVDKMFGSYDADC